jgi:5-formyltetrahydrofolate cyclo-ligase
MKQMLRSSLLAARGSRSAQALAAARSSIATLALARAGSLPCVAAYRPMRTEPGSFELLDGLVRAGCSVLVPVLLPDRDLAWQTYPSSAAASLDAVSLMFVPALAVDRAGNRLGRGGGSYDRVLGRLAAGVPAIALLFEDEVLPAVPADSWDRPVTEALTPGGWVPLGGMPA